MNKCRKLSCLIFVCLNLFHKNSAQCKTRAILGSPLPPISEIGGGGDFYKVISNLNYK